MRWNVSGPLITSVMALFGDESWIRTAADLTFNQTILKEGTSTPPWWKPFCEKQPLYHSNITQCDSGKEPSETVAQWFDKFFTQRNSAAQLEDLISVGMMLANKAVLLTHRDRQAPRLLYTAGQRRIYSSSGFFILKPNISFASIVVISLLVAIQIAGLIFGAVYIAKTPTWTRIFNAMAIARIGSGLEKENLPADGQYAEDGDYEKLRTAKIPLYVASADAIRRRPGKAGRAVDSTVERRDTRYTFYVRVPTTSAASSA